MLERLRGWGLFLSRVFILRVYLKARNAKHHTSTFIMMKVVPLLKYEHQASRHKL